MVRMCYEIRSSEAEWNPIYQQSYLGEIGWNDALLERVVGSLMSVDIRGNKVLAGELFNSIVDSIERLGMLYLGQELLAQQSTKYTGLSQVLLKFHYYHWLYDSVACLDSLARILNARFDLRVPLKEVSLNRRLVNLLSPKDEDLFRFLEKEYEWIEELKDMRSTIIHREGRLITGGGSEPCLVMDFNRMFAPDIDLKRARLPNLVTEFMVKIDALCLRIISTVPSVKDTKGA
jgi:hypothetical protein